MKPFLDSLFSGKELISCRSAVDDFRSILSTLGGAGERARAEALLSRVRVVPDAESAPRLARLYTCRKMKARSLAIFGTGDALRVMTVSANSGFVRAAKGQVRPGEEAGGDALQKLWDGSRAKKERL